MYICYKPLLGEPWFNNDLDFLTIVYGTVDISGKRRDQGKGKAQPRCD